MSAIGLKAVLAAAAALAVLTACDELGQLGNTCASTGGVPIDATDGNRFMPDTLQVTPNQTVCWQNRGTVAHTVTTILGIPAPLDTFDITLPPDFTFSRAFGNARDVRYECRLHNETGIIRVR